MLVTIGIWGRALFIFILGAKIGGTFRDKKCGMFYTDKLSSPDGQKVKELSQKLTKDCLKSESNFILPKEREVKFIVVSKSVNRSILAGLSFSWSEVMWLWAWEDWNVFNSVTILAVQLHQILWFLHLYPHYRVLTGILKVKILPSVID